MSDDHDSLKAAFEKLEAERALSWSAEQLGSNRSQRDSLRVSFDPAQAVQVGQRIDSVDLRDLDGTPVALDALTDGPLTVLIFFRFATCAADNIALPYYDRHLRPALEALGVPIVALSPQVPDRLAEIVRRHALGFRVVNDPDNALARQFGIVFQPVTVPATPLADWIGAITGTQTWELPMPTVVIVDGNRTVTFVATSPDWLDRIEAPEILAAVRLALAHSIPKTTQREKDFA